MARHKSGLVGGFLVFVAIAMLAAYPRQALWFIGGIIGAYVLIKVIILPKVRHTKEKRTEATIANFLTDVVRETITNYDQLTESDIARSEQQLRITIDPFNETRNADLLYALRVSKCLPNIQKLDTLASRWNVACLGAGEQGLLTGKRSLHYQSVYDFLSKKYLLRFTELADGLIRQTEEKASKRKSIQAKVNCWQSTRDKITTIKSLLEYKLPVFETVISAFLNQIDEKTAAVDDGPVASKNTKKEEQVQ